MYLGLVTLHGTIMVFFLLTGGLSGTFSNILIPLQLGARDMASGFLNMLSYWFFFISSLLMFASLFVHEGAVFGYRLEMRLPLYLVFGMVLVLPWLGGPFTHPIRFTTVCFRFWFRNDIVVVFDDHIYRFFSYRFIELYCNCIEFENKRNDND